MSENETAVTVREQTVKSECMTLKQVTDRVNMVHEILHKVMLKGTHYGSVPGCGPKDVLLKPGADLLAMTFRLVPRFEVERRELENGHREFDVTCSMFNPSGELLGQGVGSASTMEKKYRYRKDASGNRIENEDIADLYNTVLKIAKKRSHIDATLTVTGAADIFTQDLIEEDEQKPEIKPPQAKSSAPQPAPQQGPPLADPGLISDKQRVRLFAIARTANVSEDDIKKHLKSVYQIEHTTEIRKAWYDSIVHWVEAGGQNLSDADENQSQK